MIDTTALTLEQVIDLIVARTEAKRTDRTSRAESGGRAAAEQPA